MCPAQTRAHPCARPRCARLILRLLAAAERGPGRARSAAVPAAEALALRFVFLPLLSNPSKAAAEGGRNSRVPRTRAARGIAPIRLSGQGWPVSRTRPPAANRPRSERRGAEGAVFFGYFLLGKQKKVTGRQDGGRNTHGCESVIAKAPTLNHLALTLTLSRKRERGKASSRGGLIAHDFNL